MAQFFYTLLLSFTLLLTACGDTSKKSSDNNTSATVDSTVDSTSDSTSNSTSNSIPIANAGADQSINTSSSVTLSALESSDSNLNKLIYSWSIRSKPTGSNATLSDTTVINPTFIADIDGVYIFQLIVNDGTVNSSADTVTITASSAYDIIYNDIGYNTVVSPYTNRVWLDRNLGASKVCETYDDSQCIGDYYQWGRLTDGHEKITSSWTTTKLESRTSLTNSLFYRAYQGGDWLNNAYEIADKDIDGVYREETWGLADGNGICPIGFRVPSSDELKAETVDNNFTEPSELLNNFLKIIPTGRRRYNVYIDDTEKIFIWSKTSSYSDSYYLNYWDYRPYGGTGVGGGISYTETRADGMPVRCIKE